MYVWEKFCGDDLGTNSGKLWNGEQTGCLILNPLIDSLPGITKFEVYPLYPVFGLSNNT